MRKTGGLWEPARRSWCVQPRRIGPVIRELKYVTDPLFRGANTSRRGGIKLDAG
jgi:hypothetical protein